MYKEVKIVMLPSEEYEALVSIGKFVDTDKLFYRTSRTIPRGYGQHLYITSDDEIKEGDWVMNHGFDSSFPIKAENKMLDMYIYSDINKIIASTNYILTYKLNKDLNLPSLSEDFIKEYIETYNKGLNIIAKVEYDEGVTGKNWGNRLPTDKIYYWPSTDGEIGALTIKIYLHTKENWNKEEVEALLFKLHKVKNVTHNFSIYDWTKENLK